MNGSTEYETTVIKNVSHAERDHALRSPSSSKIWLDCALYTKHKRKAEAEGVEYDTKSAASERGTWLHEIAEQAMRLLLTRDSMSVAEAVRAVVMRQEEEGYLPLPKADIEQVEIAMNAALELIEPLDDVTIMLEVGVPLRYEPGQKGSVDVVAFNHEFLIVIDYKFGRMPVEPDAPQLKIYASELMAELRRRNLIEDPDSNLRVQTAIVQPALHYEALVAETDEDSLESFADSVMQTVKRQEAGLDRRGASELDTCEWCPFKSRCAGYVALVSSIMTETFDVVEADEAPEAGEIPLALVERIVRNRKAIETLIKDCVERIVEDEDEFPDWTRTRVSNPLRWNSELLDEAEIAFQLRLAGVNDPYTLASPAKIKAVYKDEPEILSVIESHCLEQGFHVRLKPPKDTGVEVEETKPKRPPQAVNVSNGSPRLKEQVEAAMKPAALKKAPAKKRAAKKAPAKKAAKKEAKTTSTPKKRGRPAKRKAT